MKQFSRLMALVLSLVMLCSVFLTGCGDQAQKTGETGENATQSAQNQTQTQEDKSEIYDAEVKDLQGHEFVFYVKDGQASHLSYVEVYADEITGDKVNDAVFKRNSQLQTDYNCTISEVRATNLNTSVRDPLITGEYIADFVFTSAEDVRNLAKSNLVVDFSELENIDLTKSWIDQGALEGLNMAGKIFFVTGDACTIDDRWGVALFYNVEFVKEWDQEANLYQDVRDGKWTVDRMYQVIQGTAMDLDGDGQIKTYNKDRVGYITSYSANWYHVVGCGVTLSNYSIDGDIEIPTTPKRDLLDVWDECRKVIATPLRATTGGGKWPDGTVFRSGLATFYACNIGSLLNWGDVNYQLGILPFPKRNEAQEKYYGAVSFRLGGFAIPNTVSNDPDKDWEKAGFTSGAEMCAYFLEAYSYYSVNTLTPAFFEQVLGKQIVMDEDSVEMLEIAISNRVYDPAVGYDFGKLMDAFRCGSVPDSFGTDINYDNFTTTYVSKVTEAREALRDYLTFINAEDVA